MARNTIIILFFFFPIYFTHAQVSVPNEKNSQTNKRSNLTSEQIREHRDRMFEMLRKDFANLEKYKNENEKINHLTNNGNRVVFFGNSITEWWEPYWETHFPNKAYINRGIAGQTTAQMLIRFKSDVINLNPKIVVILAGINDITGMMGPTNNDMIKNNISSMVEIANANNIKVILSSILPCYSIVGRPDLTPAERIVEMNDWLKQYASLNSCIYLDYFSYLVDDNNGMKKELTDDGLHPNKKGYDVMTPLVEELIQRVLYY